MLNVVGDHRLERSGAKEVLLADAQGLARIGGVVRVEHATQVHDTFAFDDGIGEALRVERVVVELFQRLCFPQAQGADIVGAVAADRHIVRDGANNHVIERDDALLLFTTNNEGVAVFHPSVGLFGLVTALNVLLEQPVAVEDAIAGHRQILCGTGIQEACSEASQATVTQRGVIFRLENINKLMAVFAGCLFSILHQTKVGEVVQQSAAHQELGGKVVLLAGGAVGVGCGLPLVR